MDKTSSQNPTNLGFQRPSTIFQESQIISQFKPTENPTMIPTENPSIIYHQSPFPPSNSNSTDPPNSAYNSKIPAPSNHLFKFQSLQPLFLHSILLNQTPI